EAVGGGTERRPRDDPLEPRGSFAADDHVDPLHRHVDHEPLEQRRAEEPGGAGEKDAFARQRLAYHRWSPTLEPILCHPPDRGSTDAPWPAGALPVRRRLSMARWPGVSPSTDLYRFAFSIVDARSGVIGTGCASPAPTSGGPHGEACSNGRRRLRRPRPA